MTRPLLMLAYWYPPVNESGALRPARFRKYLPANGYASHVVAAPFTGVDAQANRPGEATSRLFSHRLLGFLGRIAQRVAPYNDRLEWVGPAYLISSRLVREQKIQAVVSTAPPVAVLLVGWLLSLRYRLAWIVDFRDPLVGNPFRTRKFGRIYDRFIERHVVARASAVVVNTDTALEAYRKRYPAFAQKFHLIWNGYDPQDDLRAISAPSREYRVMAHLGTLYGARHPGVVLSSLQRLADRGAPGSNALRIRLIGSVDRSSPWLESPAAAALSARGCLEYNDKIVPRDEAQREMASADSLLLLDLNDTGASEQVPGKLFEYIRVGRPILAVTSRNSPVERILSRAGIAHTCIYANDPPDEVDRKLQAFLELSPQARAPSAWFQEQFDATAQTRTLAGLLDAAIRGPASAESKQRY